VKPASEMRLWLGRSALIAMSTAVALVAVEVGVRVGVPEAYWRARDASMDWETSAETGWTMRGNLDVSTLTESGELVRFRTNQDGLQPHDAATQRRDGWRRILLVGDSTVVSRGVPAEHSIHSALTRELERLGPVEVLNAGVEGFSTDQTLLRLRDLVVRYKPDVVLHAICDNDFSGNEAAVAYGIPKPRFRLEADGALVLDRVARDELPLAISRFSSGPRAWLNRSAIYRVFRPWALSVRARYSGSRDAGLMGLPFALYVDRAIVESLNWPLLTALLGEMKQVVESGGGELVVYAHPALPEVWDPFVEGVSSSGPSGYDRYSLESRYRVLAERQGVVYCPLIDYFLANQSRGPFHLLPRDPHCNKEGYQLTAEVLAACLKRHGILG
jgi:hypothetical protein